MTEIIKATSDAELLTLIPRVAGYSATNSMICAAFAGKRTGAGFRVDLPKRQRLADYRAISSFVIGALGRMPGVDGVAFALYTDVTFESEHGIPWVEFERHLSERLHRAGFIIKGGFCVSPDGWASYFDRDYPRNGRSLAEIEPPEPLPEIGEWARLPDVTPLEQYACLEAIVDVCSGYWPDELEHLAGASDIEIVEAIIEWEGEVPLALGALLIDLAQSPARRDVISLQISFGQIVAEVVQETNAHYLRVQAEEGGTMDDVVRREVDAGRASLDDEFTGLLMGKGRLRPVPERMNRMIDLLRQLIALSPAHYRPGPLCILAYLLWARGLSSAAGAFVDMALDIEPDYGMAQLMHTMLANSMVPEWVYG